MTTPPGTRRLFRFWRSDHARFVDDELRFHIEAAVAEHVAAGMSPEAARAAALQRFGNVDSISRTLRDLSQQGERHMQRKEWWATVGQDLRFGLRQLRRSPGFAAIAMLTLALGIGANTAIFSIVDSVLLRPLPYAHAERLVDLKQDNGSNGMVVPFPNFLEWVRQARSFEAIGGYVWQTITLTGAGEPQRLTGNRMSAGYWKAVHVPPLLGRYYTDADDHFGGPNVVVLSYATWKSTFGADSSIVGRRVLFDDIPYTVVAVAPRAYSMTARTAAFWVPLAPPPDEAGRHRDHELTVVGLLRPGVTPGQASRELTRIDATVDQADPEPGMRGVVVTPLVDAIVGTAKRQYLILFGAVGLVLLIACGNVANLLLARAVTRRAEFAVRSALGAGSGRIVSQLLIEGMLLAAGGALLGVAVGAVGLRFLVANSPAGVPRLDDAAINPIVLAFAVVLALLSAVIFGLAPAMRASRTDLQQTLRDAGRETKGAARDRLRGALIVAEVALALVLLTGAGLLLQSARKMQQVNPGFDPSNLLTARLGLPALRYPADSLTPDVFARIEAGARAVPGVAAAAMITRIPIGAGGSDCSVRLPGAPESQMHDANFRSVTPGYFKTMRTPVMQGREFTSADQRGAPLVAVINAGLARTLFGTANPIGRRFVQCIGFPAERTVVGVIPDIRANGLNQDAADEVYYPLPQVPSSAMTLVVRTTVPPESVLPQLRRAVAAIDPQLPLAGVATMRDIIARSTASSRFTTLLLLVLGGSGLLLATIGIYGVISYFVTQRTHEMGVRLALGATGAQVRGIVVRQGLVLAFTGVVVGEVVAWFATRVLSDLVFGVTVRDVATFGSVGLLLIVIAMIASFIPAWRATRIDPLTALRG